MQFDFAGETWSLRQLELEAARPRLSRIVAVSDAPAVFASYMYPSPVSLPVLERDRLALPLGWLGRIWGNTARVLGLRLAGGGFRSGVGVIEPSIFPGEVRFECYTYTF